MHSVGTVERCTARRCLGLCVCEGPEALATGQGKPRGCSYEAERVFVGSREGGLDDGSNPFLLRIIDRFMVLTVQTWEYHSQTGALLHIGWSTRVWCARIACETSVFCCNENCVLIDNKDSWQTPMCLQRKVK